MMLKRFSTVCALVLTLLCGQIAFAADEAKIRDFLRVTGFDVAITSIQQGAMAGPALTGEDPEVFGRQWVQLAEQVFDPDEMLNDAVAMLDAIMPEELLDHGTAFYGSELGQRVVAVENESHVQDDDLVYEQGEKLAAALIDEGSIRVDVFRAMGEAIGSTETAIKSIVEIQVRYLMGAVVAGASDLDIGEAELRQMLLSQADQMRENIEVNGLISNAYAYRDLSDDDLIDYLAALQEPQMGQVYEILNAIQYQIMAERYEALASKLAGLSPEQEL